MIKIFLAAVATLIFSSVLFYNQVTLFAINPIGAVPEGRIVVIQRDERLGFFESADGICIDRQGYVSLMCRGIILSEISRNKEIYFQLPYSKWIFEKTLQ